MTELPAQELRVLGCLVEKELTTPQQYPLTLNALTLACNQSSNRSPVVAYDERFVEAAVTSAKARGLARFVHPSHGRSAIRYAHNLGEVLGLDTGQLALLAVLMLRGPQTPGELRARTERMASFETLSDLELELSGLSQRPEPLVVRLGRQPGQKEDRYAHLLGGPAPLAEPREARAVYSDSDAGPLQDVSARPDLEEALAELRDEVADLRRQLGELRAQLGD